ncbi:MAG: glycan metabolism protein [Bacteroidetes bacterium GWF2_42_66]|nr:MAG: glycan metabolism protein [Bacteroidetes bacterium GWA2_42_15]OFY03095.1 MAG: glycan metabolism protein [Bacteroidetes bacterium GWE2_42_39]OFY45203.1 MAG: glycan metabolism protein [Bacteroidetes bacterium GWF2_42_66]HBL74145.1 RagB/SusD family nutrient uptake outer membrane protein [Prolixibacteraceae bacterium]HCR90600.1 RagB/SusD family nutrient uptake outer membrane protein [Prolixibacteraceae bacterium]
MKNITKTIKYGLFCFLFILNFSCNEQRFLEEDPLDFYSLDNSYITSDNFESALTDLYARVRKIHFANSQYSFSHLLATDIAKHARGTSDRFGDYDVWMVPTNAMVKYHWVEWYKVISNANTIISRLDNSKLTNEQKSAVAAEAKFFRAFAYRYLVYLYGGVPLILEEVTSPRINYTRATKEETLNQIVMDLTEATKNLPSNDKVKDGKVSNIVASHYLAETYISLQKYDEAIVAASTVIDDPNTSLMTSRFGTRANEAPWDDFLDFKSQGDVFWDLFQPRNQNRSSGNKEALWVAQMEVDVPGGYLITTAASNNRLEQWAGPVHYQTYKDPDGKEGMGELGRSNYNTGGRGNSFLMNTDFWIYTLWESDWNNDIRNAPHNIIRDTKYTNVNSAWYDSSAVKYPSPTWLNQKWRWYPWPSKITTPQTHPDNIYQDKENRFLKAIAGTTYKDMYYLRLAETYLLRAEAYLGKGDKLNAASNINVVRERSHASPISSNEVTLDYILDERARELVYEEQRRITLCRTGKLVERVRKYNDLNSDEIKDFHNLWPIPQTEIEANKDVVIEQNPGY